MSDTNGGYVILPNAAGTAFLCVPYGGAMPYQQQDLLPSATIYYAEGNVTDGSLASFFTFRGVPGDYHPNYSTYFAVGEYNGPIVIIGAPAADQTDFRAIYSPDGLNSADVTVPGFAPADLGGADGLHRFGLTYVGGTFFLVPQNADPGFILAGESVPVYDPHTGLLVSATMEWVLVFYADVPYTLAGMLYVPTNDNPPFVSQDILAITTQSNGSDFLGYLHQTL